LVGSYDVNALRHSYVGVVINLVDMLDAASGCVEDLHACVRGAADEAESALHAVNCEGSVDSNAVHACVANVNDV
jgi:hypothetical protein